MATASNLLTNHTCSEACWFAREEVCRCSCGGKNHGILLSADGKKPQRTCLIHYKRYRLEAIAGFMESCNIRFAITEQAMKSHIYEAADDRPATASQQKWPEVAAWIDSHDEIPRLIWVLESYHPAVTA
jgi:hypothetical protein